MFVGVICSTLLVSGLYFECSVGKLCVVFAVMSLVLQIINQSAMWLTMNLVL